MKAGSRTRGGAHRSVSQLDRRRRPVAYCAIYREPDRPVALKTIATQELDPSELSVYRERFQRAGQVARILHHVSIANIYDYGEASGVYYFAEEYLAAKSLAAIQGGEGRRFNWTEILSIAEQSAAALDYAHTQHVIHLDLRPSKIFLFDSGQVKLTDFSVAEMGVKTEAQTAAVVRYLSPEQVNHGKLDRRSNVFSLGAILYELVTGNSAFPGDDYNTVSRMVLYLDPGPPRDLEQAFGRDLKRALLRALEKRPGDRYSNCRDFVRELRRMPDPLQSKASLAQNLVASIAAVDEDLRLLAAEAKDSGAGQEQAFQLDSRFEAKPEAKAKVPPEPDVERAAETGALPEPGSEATLGVESFTATANAAPAGEMSRRTTVEVPRAVSQQPELRPQTASGSSESVPTLIFGMASPGAPAAEPRPYAERPAEPGLAEPRVVEGLAESARKGSSVTAEHQIPASPEDFFSTPPEDGLLATSLLEAEINPAPEPKLQAELGEGPILTTGVCEPIQLPWSGPSPGSSPSRSAPPVRPPDESPALSVHRYRLGAKLRFSRSPWPLAVATLALFLVAGAIFWRPFSHSRYGPRYHGTTPPQTLTTSQTSGLGNPQDSPHLTSQAGVSVPKEDSTNSARGPEPAEDANPRPAQGAGTTSSASPAQAATGERPTPPTARPRTSPASGEASGSSSPKLPEPPEPEARSEARIPPVGGEDSAVSSLQNSRLLVSANVRGASIAIDGSSEADWIAPHLFSDLPPGPHQLVVYKAGYEQDRRVVNLAKGESLQLRGILAPAVRGPGELDIITDPPGAEVLVDSRPAGLSPVQVVVAVGQHTYTIRQPGSPPYQGTVDVKEGTVVTRRVKWSAR